MNNEELDLINKTVWWIPFKNKRNNLRNKLIDIIEKLNSQIYDKNLYVDNNPTEEEILCYPLNWLKYIDSDNFLVKLKNLIKDLDNDSIETVLYFLNRIIKFYRKSDNRLKYMNSKEISDNEFMIEKSNMVLDFEDYQYYNGMKLTNVEEKNIRVGFIKVDIEGEEKKFLERAKRTIIKQRPYMVISIYHNESDFFDIKPIIESYNADYGFRIVKMIPYVGAYEIVLFCYPKNNKVKAKHA